LQEKVIGGLKNFHSPPARALGQERVGARSIGSASQNSSEDGNSVGSRMARSHSSCDGAGRRL
jgi:hypothetical protein